MASMTMGSAFWHVRRVQSRLGPVWTVAFLIMIATVMVLAWSVAEKRAVVEALHRDTAQREAHLHRVRDPATASHTSSAAWRSQLPGREALPDIVSAIYGAADEVHVSTLRADYQWTPRHGTGFARYRMHLPVRGRYVSIRRFIDRTLAKHPAVALKSVTIRRHRIEEAEVDADVELVVFVAEKERAR